MYQGGHPVHHAQLVQLGNGGDIGGVDKEFHRGLFGLRPPRQNCVGGWKDVARDLPDRGAFRNPLPVLT